jgi:hypothetical protein
MNLREFNKQHNDHVLKTMLTCSSNMEGYPKLKPKNYNQVDLQLSRY